MKTSNKNRTPEINRFLNYIEREKTAIRRELNSVIAQYKNELIEARKENQKYSDKIDTLKVNNQRLQTKLVVLESQNNQFVDASRSLLPKIRINPNGPECTPRWFSTGKWWSRETGGLDAEFVTEMTTDEIIEAVDFYGKTELPLMLPRSNRDIHDSKPE